GGFKDDDVVIAAIRRQVVGRGDAGDARPADDDLLAGLASPNTPGDVGLGHGGRLLPCHRLPPPRLRRKRRWLSTLAAAVSSRVAVINTKATAAPNGQLFRRNCPNTNGPIILNCGPPSNTGVA